MKVPFYKYQATGNDFVLIDNRDGVYRFTIDQIKNICDRRLGVGADGLMLIERDSEFDFSLVYFNSDGSESLCGNGSRAAVALAAKLGMITGNSVFRAYDGEHKAELLDTETVRLKMNDVAGVRQSPTHQYLNTGSPHYIQFTDKVAEIDVQTEGRRIRYSPEFHPKGTNVNFVEGLAGNTIFVRTYERGVEDETLSCGTGVTAAALASASLGYHSPVHIKTKGGLLSVEFQGSAAAGFTDIFLIGPAKMVFQGVLEL